MIDAVEQLRLLPHATEPSGKFLQLRQPDFGTVSDHVLCTPFPYTSPGVRSMGDIDCPFCNPPDEEVVLANDLCYARYDKYPVSPGHLLLIPYRRRLLRRNRCGNRHPSRWTTAPRRLQHRRQRRPRRRPDGDAPPRPPHPPVCRRRRRPPRRGAGSGSGEEGVLRIPAPGPDRCREMTDDVCPGGVRTALARNVIQTGSRALPDRCERLRTAGRNRRETHQKSASVVTREGGWCVLATYGERSSGDSTGIAPHETRC